MALRGDGARSTDPVYRLRRRHWGYNPVDVLSLAYLAIVCITLAIGHDRVPQWRALVLLHLGLLGAVACLRMFPRIGPQPLQFFRESYALWLLPLAYSELDTLGAAAGSRYYDDVVLRLDSAIFGGHPNAWLASALPFAPLSEFLHFAYLAYVLLVPVLGFTLYVQRRSEAFRVLTTTVVFTMYSCYVIFILFPVKGPYYTFPRLDLPGFFPHAVGEYLRGATVGAAFPSSHVAGATAVAVMAHRFSRRLSYGLIGLAVAIAVATVYGGFHYAIDALVGFLFGLSTALLGPAIHSALLRRMRLPHIPLRYPHLRFEWRDGRIRGKVVAPRRPSPAVARSVPEEAARGRGETESAAHG